MLLRVTILNNFQALTSCTDVSYLVRTNDGEYFLLYRVDSANIDNVVCRYEKCYSTVYKIYDKQLVLDFGGRC